MHVTSVRGREISLKFKEKYLVAVAFLLPVLFARGIAPAYAQEYFFLLKWGSYGSGDSQFKQPFGIACSTRIYVADSENNRIQEFFSSGALRQKWGTL